MKNAASTYGAFYDLEADRQRGNRLRYPLAFGYSACLG